MRGVTGAQKCAAEGRRREGCSAGLPPVPPWPHQIRVREQGASEARQTRAPQPFELEVVWTKTPSARRSLRQEVHQEGHDKEEQEAHQGPQPLKTEAQETPHAALGGEPLRGAEGGDGGDVSGRPGGGIAYPPPGLFTKASACAHARGAQPSSSLGPRIPSMLGDSREASGGTTASIARGPTWWYFQDGCWRKRGQGEETVAICTATTSPRPQTGCAVAETAAQAEEDPCTETAQEAVLLRVRQHDICRPPGQAQEVPDLRQGLPRRGVAGGPEVTDESSDATSIPEACEEEPVAVTSVTSAPGGDPAELPLSCAQVAADPGRASECARAEEDPLKSQSQGGPDAFSLGGGSTGTSSKPGDAESIAIPHPLKDKDGVAVPYDFNYQVKIKHTFVDGTFEHEDAATTRAVSAPPRLPGPVAPGSCADGRTSRATEVATVLATENGQAELKPPPWPGEHAMPSPPQTPPSSEAKHDPYEQLSIGEYDVADSIQQVLDMQAWAASELDAGRDVDIDVLDEMQMASFRAQQAAEANAAEARKAMKEALNRLENFRRVVDKSKSL